MEELKIKLPKKEIYIQGGYIKDIPEVTIIFRHSLRSIAKWESIFKKPFLNSDLNDYEAMEYVKCMANKEFDITRLDEDDIKELSNFMNDKPTATFFATSGKKEEENHEQEIMTSEALYANMILLNVPKDFENWNIVRLLVLLRILSIKNNPENKTKIEDIYAQNERLNEERKAKYNTTG